MEHNLQTDTRRKRRRDLDAVGYFVVLGLVFFHTSQIFSPFGFFIKDGPQSFEGTGQHVATLFIFFVTLWGMPLMFLIAGMAIWFSLHKRTAAEFARERIQRLLVPFLVGFLFFTPLNQYIIFRHQHPNEAGSYLQFLRTFIDLEFDLGSPLFIRGTSNYFSLSHMWFLIFLFVYSMLLLPLFLYLRQPVGRRLLDQVAAIFLRPWVIFVMAFPVAAIQAILGTPSAAVAATWNLWAYLFFLAYGFLFAADTRFEQALLRHKKSALLLGLLGFIVYAGGSFVINILASSDPRAVYSLVHVLLRFIQGMTGWFWIVAIMGLVLGAARRKELESPNETLQTLPRESASPNSRPSLKERMAAYASDAQLPFYILHMTPIVVIGFFVVQWEVSALAKYIVITSSSLVVTLLMYDIGVRRTRLTRFLFGSKPDDVREKRTRADRPLTRSKRTGS